MIIMAHTHTQSHVARDIAMQPFCEQGQQWPENVCCLCICNDVTAPIIPNNVGPHSSSVRVIGGHLRYSGAPYRWDESTIVGVSTLYWSRNPNWEEARGFVWNVMCLWRRSLAPVCMFLLNKTALELRGVGGGSRQIHAYMFPTHMFTYTYRHTTYGEQPVLGIHRNIRVCSLARSEWNWIRNDRSLLMMRLAAAARR